MRVHIDRAHSGFGEPVEKGRLGRSEKSLSSDSNSSIAYRKYSPNQSKSSRLPIGYEKVSKDNEKYGDIIDDFIIFSRDLKKTSTRLDY
jgi:hypothetical protein